jgi:hypothetical protein
LGLIGLGRMRVCRDRDGVMVTDSASVRTLREARQLLIREWPGRSATAAEWLAHHERGAALYAAVAETDPGHHYEALYWAQRERESAQAIADERATRSGESAATAAETDAQGRG